MARRGNISPAGEGFAGRAFCAMGRIFSRLLRDQSGNYTVIAALMSPVLIGAAGLATEGGLWYNKYQTLQGAADSAAITAATQFALNYDSNLNNQAAGVVATYGFVAGADTTITVNRPAKSGNYTTNQKSVEVIITTKQPRMLSAIFTSEPITLRGRAVALPGNNGTGCVLSLNASAAGGVTSKGTSNIALTACSLYDNSSDPSGLINSGSATIFAESVNVVGDISGGAGISTTEGINKGVSAATDPYAGVAMPAYSGCDHINMTVKTTMTLDPGVYCGGLQLNAGAIVTLNPGTYVMDRGSLQVAGGATIKGTGVTIFFTSSTGSNYAGATINGGATVAITAPTTGPLAGIAILGDRNMPTGTTFKFNGGTGQILGGAVYVPSGSLQYAGGDNTDTKCTQLIGDTITFVGNSNLANDCSGYGTKNIGSTPASLVE